MCYNMWRLKGEIDMTMNARLEMLYSEEEEYDRLKSEIRNYYINAMTTATNEEELSNVKKDFNKFQETIKRLEKINAVACKGVHDVVSFDEANQCVVQMYMILGDILRL